MCLFVFSDILLFILLVLSVLIPFTCGDESGSVLRVFYLLIGLSLGCLNVAFFVIGTVIIKCCFQHQRVARDSCFFVVGIILSLLTYFLPIWIWE